VNADFEAELQARDGAADGTDDQARKVCSAGAELLRLEPGTGEQQARHAEFGQRTSQACRAGPGVGAGDDAALFYW
jgi:hypothetical protein